jgi:transglutaminase-like putative cysteine protease
MTTQDINKEKIRWMDWLSSILLILILQIAVARLVATQWTKNLSLVQLIALFGTILGLALGKSIFRRGWVVFFAFSYGIILIPWQLGLMLDVETTWLDRLQILQGRLSAVLDELLTRKPVTDNILFILLMAILFWSLAVYTSVVLVRQANPWKVIIPGGITVFVIHSFDPLLVSRSWYLAFYLFFALLLVVRLEFIKNAAIWRQRRTHTPPDIGFDFTRIALVLSLVLVLFSWNVPIVAETFKPAVEIWQTASRPWLKTKDRLSFMFASLRASVGLVQNFYGSSLPLGLGSPLSDRVILEVEGPTNPPNGNNFYWEARTYDTYESNQWVSTIQTRQNLTKDSVDLNQPGADIRPIITFTFFPHEAISNLFTVPEPLWVNIPSQAYLMANPDGSVNYSTLMSQDFLHPGDQYLVRSALESETVSDLRTAGTSYPQWVLNDYLQLPASITSRTKQLAEQIASGYTDPYDIATAVTDYLRNNIEYNQSISQPPPNQERIDWFLFDYKQGFCNYYASAEVILLRSLGIPARMAVGFAQGQREIPPIQNLPPGQSPDASNQIISEVSTYVVRQKDAHAWPEVYFPGTGWVIFEPTASQPAIFHPTGETAANQNENQANQDANSPQNQSGVDSTNPRDRAGLESSPTSGQLANFWTFGNIVRLILLVIALAILVFITWQIRKGFRVKPFVERISIQVPEKIEKSLRRLGITPPSFLLSWIYTMKLPGISRSYLEINHALNRVGQKPEIQDTPIERAASLSSAIPAASIPTEKLLAEYQSSIYSLHPADADVAKTAAHEIRNLSWLAWLRRILSRFQEPAQPHR